MAIPTAERLDRAIDRSAGPDACWPWTGSVTSIPCLSVYLGGRRYKGGSARRLLLEVLGRPVPEGTVIVVDCAVACMNPAHFQLRTRSEQQRAVMSTGIGMCRSGRHDLTDPANVRTQLDGRRGGCLPCLRERQRAYSTAERLDGRLAARKKTGAQSVPDGAS